VGLTGIACSITPAPATASGNSNVMKESMVIGLNSMVSGGDAAHRRRPATP
jgi:hypothetical protein